MKSIADLIEGYILEQFSTTKDKQVELRRTDIADKISCAPSQISYVLSTRFTQEKGFVVESRRGLGGYIRILRVPLKSLVYQEMVERLTAETDFAEIESMVNYLLKHRMLTEREAALLLTTIGGLYQAESLDASERLRIVKSVFLTLENIS